MSDRSRSDLISRLEAGSLSRRRLVKTAALLGAAAPGLAGLHAAAAPRSAARLVRAQTDPNTLVIVDNLKDNWLQLDPGWFYEVNPSAAMNLVYERLYDLPDSTQPDQFVPMLATDFPQVSADGLEVTIPLRSGVKFHLTGNEMTAADWVFSWNRLKNIKFQAAFFATDYWESVEAVDPLTLRLRLTSPNVALVPILSAMPLSVADSAAIREHGGTDAEDADETDSAREWINEGNSAGTGPFMLTAWDIEGEVVLERFPDYWGEPPALDRIIWRNIVDANSQLQAVEAGEADIAYALDPDAAAAVAEDDSLQLITGPSLAHEYLALNVTEEVGGPVSNKLLRQAIGYAIDYDGIINDLLAGAGIKPATIAPEPLLGTEEVHDQGYSLDPPRAQELFDEADLGPVSLDLTYASGGQAEGGIDLETLVSKLKSDLEQVDGLTINLVPMDGAKRLEEYRAAKLQFTVSGWSPDYPDIHTYAEPFGRTGTAAAKRVGFSNDAVDQGLDQGIAETDPEQRKAIYVDVLSTIIDEAPFLILYQPLDQKAATSAVQGVTTHSVFMLQLRGASKSA